MCPLISKDNQTVEISNVSLKHKMRECHLHRKKKASLNSHFDPFYVPGKMYFYVRALLQCLFILLKEIHTFKSKPKLNFNGWSSSLSCTYNLFPLAAGQENCKIGTKNP